MRKIYLFLLFLFVFLTLGLFIYFLNLSPNLDNSKNDVIVFKVEKGWGLRKIASELKNNNIIRSNKLLIFISYFFNSNKDLKHGTYYFSSDLSTFAIYKELLKGTSLEDIKITIPEGYTSRRIALKLKDNGIILNKEEFLSLIKNKEFIESLGLPYDSLEGMLFPDTYKFYLDMNPKNVIRMMVFNFFVKLENIGIRFSDIKPKDFYNKIIISSIVEREYRTPSESKKIASVFLNRINIGMSLQSCATIEYIITEELKKPHPKRIFFKDLELESAYNTYINRGYPPTPISNPGIISLEAVFFPEKTNYLYFVVQNPHLGTHKFSSSYSDHLLGSSNYINNFMTKD